MSPSASSSSEPQGRAAGDRPKRRQALLRPRPQSRRQRRLDAATSTVAPTGHRPEAFGCSAAPSEPEVRKAEACAPEDLAQAPPETANSSPAESGEQNRVAIRPLKRTYVKVTVGRSKADSPAFERWVSPADGAVEFRGKHVSIRVLDPDAVQITKNGKALEDDDQDVTVN